MAWATITPKIADSELYYQDINELIANSEYLYSGFDVQHNPASGVHEAITATTFNKLTLTAPASGATLTLANGSTLATVGAYSTTLTATGTTALTLPTSGTLVTTGSKLSAFAATTSAELAGVISDETGTAGNLVFSNSPVFGTQITTPKVVTASGALTLQPASGSGVAVALATTGDFAVNTNQLVVDTSLARVGINTASPSQTLHLVSAADCVIKLASGNTGGAIQIDTTGTNWEVGRNGTVTGFYVYGNSAYRIVVKDTGLVGINTTAPDRQCEINSSTGDCLRLTYNDSNGSAANYVDHAVSSSGAGTVTTSGGDYTVHCADNYTLALTHGAWDDLMVGITGARLPSSGNPTWVAAATTGWSCELLEFSKSATNTIYFTVQMPHGYAVGTDIYCHVHWASQAAKTVAEGVRVAWSLALTWTDIGEDRSAEVTRTNYLPVQMRSGGTYTAADIVANRHYLTDFTVVATGGSGGVISGANMSLSSILCGSLSRLGGDATYDTYDDEVYLLGIDFHYQKDTLGSRTELTK